MKVGLVLEGGGMRGMFTAGVLDVFLDEGIEVDAIVGVSAGALFGVNFLSKQRGRAIRYNKRFNSDKNYLGVIPYLKERNIVSTKYAYEDVPHRLDPFDDEVYKNSGVPFYAGVTNVDTGEAEYIKVNSVFEQMDVLRASGSMPIASTVVKIDGKNYLDGGISDSIPYKWLYKQGYDKIVVILTQDITYKKKPAAPIMISMMKRKYPKIAGRMAERHRDYNRSVFHLKKWEEKGRAYVIRPDEPVKIGRMEKKPEKLQYVYDMGIKVGRETIAGLLEFLGTKQRLP